MVNAILWPEEQYQNTRKPEYLDYRSYDNIDPLEKGDSAHALFIDGQLEVSIATGCTLISLDIDDTAITLEFSKDYEDHPQGWPVGTRITLKYQGASLEANDLNPGAYVEEIDGLGSFNPFIPSENEQRLGFEKGIQLHDDSGNIWNLLYKSALVEWKLPPSKRVL